MCGCSTWYPALNLQHLLSFPSVTECGAKHTHFLSVIIVITLLYFTNLFVSCISTQTTDKQTCKEKKKAPPCRFTSHLQGYGRNKDPLSRSKKIEVCYKSCHLPLPTYQILLCAYWPITVVTPPMCFWGMWYGSIMRMRHLKEVLTARMEHFRIGVLL